MDETGAYYTEWSTSEREKLEDLKNNNNNKKKKKKKRKTSIQYTNAYIWNLERW